MKPSMKLIVFIGVSVLGCIGAVAGVALGMEHFPGEDIVAFGLMLPGYAVALLASGVVVDILRNRQYEEACQ